MCNILEQTGLKKDNSPRKKFPKDAVCCVCGAKKDEIKLRRFNEYIVCVKHYNQLEKYGKITDKTPREHKKELERCCICGDLKDCSYEGKPYCRKHYLQISRHGEISERTIYDKNEYILHDDYAEIVTFDKNGEKTGSTLVDLNKVDELKKYKIYIKGNGNKIYATINFSDGKKVRLNRYLLGIKDLDDWDGKTVVDHINGNSLDNRMCNLRICTHKQNCQNMRKKDSFTGVNFNKQSNKWVARIMHNYKAKQLGTFLTQAEALMARLKAEKEICGEFGPNCDYYYLLNHPSPIEEINNNIIKSSGGV